MTSHCRHNHEYTSNNTYVDSGGYRRCRECRRIQRCAWNKANTDKVLVYKRDWRKSISGRDYQKRWNAANPDKVRASIQRHRARKVNQIGFIPTDWERTLMSLQRGLCLYCGTSLATGYHLEHMVSLNDGGLHDHENTCLACPPCNQHKGTQTAEAFFAR